MLILLSWAIREKCVNLCGVLWQILQLFSVSNVSIYSTQKGKPFELLVFSLLKNVNQKDFGTSLAGWILHVEEQIALHLQN
jgi:hypothetical protein